MDRDALWAECAWRMQQLQAAAQWVRHTRSARGVLARLLRTMETLRAWVNDALLLETTGSSVDQCHSVLHDVEWLVDHISQAFDWQAPSRETVDRERASRLQRELDALALVQQPKGGERRDSCETTDVTRLRAMIESLRHKEQSRAFHRKLLMAARQPGGDHATSYSVDNYAYGNTPFGSWMRVCACSTIQLAVQQWRALEKDETPEESEPTTAASCLEVRTPIVVVGSSSGSLVFFSSALLGHACTGIEILSCLHDVAEELKLTHKITRCRFVQADVLATTLCNSRVVVLTSQCWDDKLYHHVLTKLANELTVGALVIDYRDGLARSTAFRLAERIDDVRVSWNQHQSLFIYERSQGEQS